MKKIVNILLSFILMLVIMPSSILAEDNYTQIFEYPSNEYLKDLGSMDAKFVACDISDDLLNMFSDDQLLDAVNDYPFLSYVDYYSSVDVFYDVLKENFSGIEELESRGYSESYIKEIIASNSKVYRESNSIMPFSIVPVDPGPGGSATTVYTPKGTAVSVIYQGNVTDYSSAEKSSIASQLRASFPNAVLKRSATRKYNCHSYAWYSTSSSNVRWMNNPSAYMSDGSYSKRASKSSARVGDKVYYGTSGNHSGIVDSISSGGVIYVVSKWGSAGLYRHTLTDCPYSSSNVTFWYR